MAADFGETVILEPDEPNFGEETQPEKKDNKVIWIIIAVVAVILLCCCVLVTVGVVWLWNNGDSLVDWIDEWSSIIPMVNLLFS